MGSQLKSKAVPSYPPSPLTIIVWEADAQMGLLDLFCEDVFLVEEKYDGSCSEVTVVADTVKEVQTFMHSVLQGKKERGVLESL